MRVLVVEDEASLASGLRRGLEAEGFTVDVASDGAVALWYAEENTYDAIVLDVMLPVLNGYDVCRRLREGENWTPILMLTARDGDGDQIEGLDAGADDYVTKPFSFEVILARLRSLVRRGSPERPALLSAGDLVLDPATKTVRRGEERYELSTREFSVLEFLMRHKGTTVTKHQILENVWDFDFDGDSNLVEVYIARVRRRVGRSWGHDDIETVRGIGYRMREKP